MASIHIDITDDTRLTTIQRIAAALTALGADDPPERGVDDDDGTVDHDHLGHINVHDGTWGGTRRYALNNGTGRRQLLDDLAGGHLLVTLTEHDGVIQAYRQRT